MKTNHMARKFVVPENLCNYPLPERSFEIPQGRQEGVKARNVFWERDLLSNRFFQMVRNMLNSVMGLHMEWRVRKQPSHSEKALGKVQERKAKNYSQSTKCECLKTVIISQPLENCMLHITHHKSQKQKMSCHKLHNINTE